MNEKAVNVNQIDVSFGTLPDPTSSSFDSAAWFREFASLKDGHNSAYKSKQGGFLFSNLDVYGSVQAGDYLNTFGNAPLRVFRSFGRLLGRSNATEVKILRNFEGFVDSGEMLAVLGRPGSGCTTLLRTLAGETRGLRVGTDSNILYQGITPDIMRAEFRGECIYTAELDVHFAELTVLETLRFAAGMRAPRCLLPRLSPQYYIEHITSVMLSIFKLEGVKNTPIGDAMIRGISGGERKRVSIAEAFMSFAPIQFWDNSTRGLDSATALDCIRNFQTFSRSSGAATTVSLYQASQDMLDCFDKVTVLYEGRQIFFGSWPSAEDYFYGLGFERPSRLTTGDFLTALTNPVEARQLIRPGYATRVPVTADDFGSAWQQSIERQKVLQHISRLRAQFISNYGGINEYRNARSLEKHPGVGKSSPFTVPLPTQIKLCLSRGFQRLKNNIGVPISYVIGNVVMAIIVGSVFNNLGQSADDVSQRTILLFFSVLINAFMSAAEVLTVWDQRPIVEKHTRHGLYHPSAEAISAIICDLPAKFAASILFNLVLYFMAGLRQTPGAFFTYWVITFACQMAMSMFYRCDGSIHRTLEASMVPVGVLIMLAIIYTGFVIPVPYMKPWLAWFRHINPVAYAFESLMLNEFHDRTFACTQYIPAGPAYDNLTIDYKSCIAPAITIGMRAVSGNGYLKDVYRYTYGHLWRNFGIILAFAVFFYALHIWSSEVVTTWKPRGDVLLFLRHQRPQQSHINDHDNNNGNVVAPTITEDVAESSKILDPSLTTHQSTLHWENVSYKVPLKKGEEKIILSDIDGYVKPGTLTALMGATGAGKTSLLDVIAQRTTQGHITGEIMVDGRPRDASFQRSTGYAQQNDIHLSTSTVREALQFSALLRQSVEVSKASKLEYVENVIELLGMKQYADAIVGVAGDGLSPEQRKRLTIAVELVGRPTSALFLDEPTSGLDSQTAFMICTLLRDLAKNSGQAIICTIHQPSSTLLGMFDRLLLIDEGNTIYFGEVGRDIGIMTRYFESKGAPVCEVNQNPAEWIMEITGNLPGSHQNWREAWNISDERQAVKTQLNQMKTELEGHRNANGAKKSEYATTFWTQLIMLTYRTFVEYWRTPAALYAKLGVYVGATFMIGVSIFHSPNSLQGLQNEMFSIYLVFTTFSNIIQQIAPHFASRRALFEARERPSKIFSWKAFITASIIVEATWQVLLAIVSWALFYYLTGMNLNTTESDRSERAILMLLLFVAFFLLTQSLSHLLVAAIEVPQTAVNISQPIYYLTTIFCGVLVSKDALPHFWGWMYHVSPLTYLLRSMFAVGTARTAITCHPSELIWIPQPPGNQVCRDFLAPFLATAGGNLVDTGAGGECGYCPMASTDQFLALYSMNYEQRWRDLGITLVYVVFNWVATFILYWIVRVPNKQKLIVKRTS
jgi:ATP-binding cassette subfamily G (WHITE) protein 2 (PDR)